MLMITSKDFYDNFSLRLSEILLFFFKQKTAYEMRISDWSSDVCSSDLGRSQMKAEDLKALQSPLKERYRENPTAAHVTLTAEGKLGDESLTCSVETGRALVEAGMHPATGGDGLTACSGDMLLQALVDRTSVVAGKSVSARVDLGVCRLL